MNRRIQVRSPNRSSSATLILGCKITQDRKAKPVRKLHFFKLLLAISLLCLFIPANICSMFLRVVGVRVGVVRVGAPSELPAAAA